MGRGFQVGERLLFLGVDGGGTRCRARLADFKWRHPRRGHRGAGQHPDQPGRERAVGVRRRRAMPGAGRGVVHGPRCGLPGARRRQRAQGGRCAPNPRSRSASAASWSPRTRMRRAWAPTAARMAGSSSSARAASAGPSTAGGAGAWAAGAFPVSDEGSGAWIGWEAVQRTLRAHDGRTAWTPLLRRVSQAFDSDPHAVVRWMGSARPRDFGRWAPLVLDHAGHDDPAARAIMRLAAGHIDAIAARLAEHGATRLALMGGLAAGIEPWLSTTTRARLVPPAGDALDGALRLARKAAHGVRPLASADPQNLDAGGEGSDPVGCEFDPVGCEGSAPLYGSAR